MDIQCVQGDITAQPDLDAIVNAANARLATGGGVAGAIHRAAGPQLARECAPLAPIEPGQAVLTGGHGLPNPHVIHCLGPVYGRDRPADRLLAECYRNALRLAEDAGQEIGFSMADRRDSQIFALFVLPEHEGKGVGTSLLTRATDWLEYQGKREAWLTTGLGTRADRFYVARGWTAAGFGEPGERMYRLSLARLAGSRALPSG